MRKRRVVRGKVAVATLTVTIALTACGVDARPEAAPATEPPVVETTAAEEAPAPETTTTAPRPVGPSGLTNREEGYLAFVQDMEDAGVEQELSRWIDPQGDSWDVNLLLFATTYCEDAEEPRGEGSFEDRFVEAAAQGSPVTPQLIMATDSLVSSARVNICPFLP